MATTINSYSVSLGMDARGYIDGANLSRAETRALIRDIEAARTPAENFAADHDRLRAALEKGSISLGVYNRMLQAKREQYGMADKTLKDYASSLVGPLAVGFGAVTIAATAATAAGVAFISHMKETQNAIDDVSDSATKLGLSYNELTGLRFAGQEGGGLDAATVDASIKKMMINISNAVSDPANPINLAFERLGVTAGDLIKAGPTEAVMQIADGMQNVNNQADKLALAMQLFGKSGTEMVSTLEGGRDAIAESLDFQNRWNGLTDAQVVAVGASNDAYDRISVVIGGISTKLSAEMAPAFLVIAESVLETAGGIDSIDQAMQMVVNTTAYYLGQLKDIAELFVAMPMMMTGMGDTSFAFDLNSGQRAMQAVIDKRMELENKAIQEQTARRLQQQRMLAEDSLESIKKEEAVKVAIDDRLERNALRAASQHFDQLQATAIRLRDEIAKGPGGGMEAGSADAARFMADQVNKAMASSAVSVPDKPTDEQLVEIAQKEYEQSLIDSKKADELALLVRKLVDKEPQLARAR